MTAPAIVLLHAAGHTRRMWLPQTLRLRGDFRTVALDLPGHGARADERFSFSASVDAVSEALAHENIGQAVFVGVSLGGCVAMDYAARNPNRVAGLVLSGSTFDPCSLLCRLVLTGEGVVFPRGARLFTRAQARFLRVRYPEDVAEEIIAAGMYWGAAADAVRAMRGVNFRTKLAAFPGPTLILNGRRDWVHRTAERSFAAAARNARVQTVARAGHIANLDEPDAFADALRDFAVMCAQDFNPGKPVTPERNFIPMPKTVVLVYSGGLDTSVAIPMMREDYGFERIVTVTVDVGQPAEDVQSAETRAKALGCEHYTADAKAEFVTDYCWPAVRANGDYQGYPLSTAIARPLIGLKAVEVAKRVGADAFCHGCTGKGNDQFRIEYVMRALLPDTPIIAPMREHNYTRTEEIEYAKAKNIPISVSADKIWSIDENLWGRSIEGGHLEEPGYAPPEEIFQWTKGIDDANPTPQTLTIGFENGVPVALDGVALAPLDLVVRLNKIAGDNGVGRVDIMEDRLLGLKVRENYECPASTILIKAHAALEALVATAAERKFKTYVDQQWGELAYYGLWFDPLKDDLEAFIGKIQERVTGTVTLRLFKSSLTVVGRSSDWALYNEDLASFDSKTFDQRLSVGNVQTHGMQSRMYWALKEKHDK